MKTISYCVAAAWLTTLAPAAPLTITWGAQGRGAALASSSGQELPPGCLVRLGFFHQSLNLIQEAAWDPAALESHFTEIARAETGEFDGSQFGIPGGFAQTIMVDTAALPTGLSQRTLCVWAFNASTASTATETGIFTCAGWQMPRGQAGGLIWDLNQVEPAGIVVGASSPTQSPTLGGQMNQLASMAGLLDTSDGDGDGIEHLLEEAFGMNDAVPDAEMMPAVVVLEDTDRTQPGYRYRRPLGGSSVNGAVYVTGSFRYSVEVSDDLQSWRTEAAACVVLESEPSGEGFEIVTLCAGPEAKTIPEFYRLKVERITDSGT